MCIRPEQQRPNLHTTETAAHVHTCACQCHAGKCTLLISQPVHMYTSCEHRSITHQSINTTLQRRSECTHEEPLTTCETALAREKEKKGIITARYSQTNDFNTCMYVCVLMRAAGHAHERECDRSYMIHHRRTSRMPVCARACTCVCACVHVCHCISSNIDPFFRSQREGGTSLTRNTIPR